MMKKLLTLLALTLTTVSFSFAAPKVGDAAPAFTLADSTGKTHSLADFKGKYVVLEWTNHGCPFVKKHYESGNMPSVQKELTADGVVWLSICSSAPGKQGFAEPAEAGKIHQEHGAASTSLLIDSDGKVGKLYDAKTTPQMVLISPESKVLYEGAIDSIPSADKADIAKATNYVKAAYGEAKAGKAVTTSSTKSYGCGVKY